jgi:aminoglycoside phosphotransferase (APT) family kinase protein
MDYVEGSCLEDVWPDMSIDQRLSIARQLRCILSTMRAAPPATSNLIGGCNGPARDCRYISDYTGGPFESEAEFNEFILNLGKRTPSLVRRTLSESLHEQNGHRIVFTHADLSPRNIIVQDGQIKGLLDWEFAGWYPEYWEYIKFFDRPAGCDGWYELAETIFEDLYPRELLTHQAIARWQRP